MAVHLDVRSFFCYHLLELPSLKEDIWKTRELRMERTETLRGARWEERIVPREHQQIEDQRARITWSLPLCSCHEFNHRSSAFVSGPTLLLDPRASIACIAGDLFRPTCSFMPADLAPAHARRVSWSGVGRTGDGRDVRTANTYGSCRLTCRSAFLSSSSLIPNTVKLKRGTGRRHEAERRRW